MAAALAIVMSNTDEEFFQGEALDMCDSILEKSTGFSKNGLLNVVDGIVGVLRSAFAIMETSDTSLQYNQSQVCMISASVNLVMNFVIQ